MPTHVEKAIAALQRERFSLTPAEIHRAVDRALRPEEPATPGTIVVLYGRPYVAHGVQLMDSPDVVLQYAPGSPMDAEENGFARWADVGAGAYRTWEWICERDGEKRVFVPLDSLGDGCCAVDGPCRNGCVES